MQIKSIDLINHIIIYDADDQFNVSRNYETQPQIKETQEVITDNLVVEWLPWENEWDEAVATTVNKPKTTTVKTGAMIPNPNYVDPRNKQALENWLVLRHWFTK
jgi:hypothetical protein